jgi:Flp pilus assembly protein TadD
MNALRSLFRNRLRHPALLLVLACAGCSPPAVKEADRMEPPKAAATKPADDRPATSGKPVAASTEQTAAQPPLSIGEQELEKGIKSYEDGQYKVATKEMQSALDLGLAARSDQAKAHRYLAFINCVSGRPNGCRDEFRKAFAADPNFDLTPAEAGWGPVFRSVKTAAAKAKPK